jgi:hypothetical protein
MTPFTPLSTQAEAECLMVQQPARKRRSDPSRPIQSFVACTGLSRLVLREIRLSRTRPPAKIVVVTAQTPAQAPHENSV